MRTAAVALVLALAACSTAAEPQPMPAKAPQCLAGAVLACDGGWATCSASGELGGCVLASRPSESDSGAPGDAAVPPEACALPPVSSQALGVDCEVLSSGCGCAAGVRYRCTAPDYRSQPSTSVVLGGAGVPGGCRTLSVDGTTLEHCCAPACVRHARADAQCEPGHPNAYHCAPGVDAGIFCNAVGGVHCCGE